MIRVFNIIAATLLFLSCISYNAEQGSPDIVNVDLNKKAQAEFRSSLRLPKNAKIKYFHEINGLDQITKSIVLMVNKSFIDWIANFHLNIDSFDNNKRYLLGQNVDEWNPASPKALETAQVRFENGMVLNIGYTTKNDELVVVYLVFHG